MITVYANFNDPCNIAAQLVKFFFGMFQERKWIQDYFSLQIFPRIQIYYLQSPHLDK